jgi:glucose/arabinose dehydrogenase
MLSRQRRYTARVQRRIPVWVSALLAIVAACDEATQVPQWTLPMPLDGGGMDGGAEADAAGVEGGTAPMDATPSDGPSDDGAMPEAGAPADASSSDASTGGPGIPHLPVECQTGPKLDLSGLALEKAAVSDTGWLVYAAQAPGSDDWYLVEQTGRIWLWLAAEQAIADVPFLDLTDEIQPSSSNSPGEAGLLSLAFAPDYLDSGRFYVMGTPVAGPNMYRDMVLGYRRSAADPHVADPNTRQMILQLPISNANHNGGMLAFGPDGMLYVSTGDGGGYYCQMNVPDGSQDIGSLFGKILRLDLSNPPSYGAADNPFVGTGDPRVLHYGLRNPFRFSFDRQTGDLYIADVGEDTYEEINHAGSGVKGLNFGWPAYEVDAVPCPGHALRPGSEHTSPVLAIKRDFPCEDKLCNYGALIAASVYRGQAIPRLQGDVLFADYQQPMMGALYTCADGSRGVSYLRKSCDADAGVACLSDEPMGFVASVVSDHQGELYFVTSDRLLKLVPAASVPK